MLATRGCLPFRRVEGNTQSPGWEYVVFCFQRSMNSASNGWSGTGPFDSLLFGKPTWPHVQVRRTWIVPSAKLMSCHCKPKHSDIRRPVPAAQSGGAPVRGSEVTPDGIRLFGGENHRFVSAGCLAADKAHGVRLLVSRN